MAEESTTNRLNDSFLRVIGPLIVTLVIMGMFAYAFVRNPFDAGLTEILKSVTVLAIGFWLGSSSGSKGSAAVPGITSPRLPDIPFPPVMPPPPPPEPSPTVVVQTGSPANAEAAPAPPAPERTPPRQPRPGGGLIQGLPRS